MHDPAPIRRKYLSIQGALNERGRRLWAAAEAKALGWGGKVAVALATGLSSSTVGRGMKELAAGDTAKSSRVRKPGGGRKLTRDICPGLPAELEKLVESTSRGDPEKPLRWTSKSTRNLADELKPLGYKISHAQVGKELKKLDYSLQGTAKMKEGGSSPDRNAQFQRINAHVAAQLSAGEPVISVDTKKKELVGNFKNGGQEWMPKGMPFEVNVYDFPTLADGKAVPYGAYDLGRNEGWVSVGVSHDTASFASSSIRSWWKHMGSVAYPNAKSLTITADCGGSNGRRVRLWKWELQRFADETGLTVHVLHYPPGTSKWNKIEHRMFSFISKNWRGQPLTTFATVVNLIGGTKTKTGLKIRCELDMNAYPKKVKVSDDQMKTINMIRAEFRGDWNYTISPHAK